MADESQSLADMNWRLVDDAKEAVERKDYMLALSLFEQSRRICINECWRDGVHYADDMILDIYPMVKRQIDESNWMTFEKHDRVEDDADTRMIPHKQLYFNAETKVDEEEGTTNEHVEPNQARRKDDSDAARSGFFEDRSNRRLRRMMGSSEKE